MAVDYRKEGRIAVFTINRPEAMNALNNEAHRELCDGMLDFRDDPDLWVAIVTGVGNKAFCAGDDLKEVGSRRTGDDKPVKAYRLANTIWKPFIAAINGYCLGGGLELALSCDLRIAAEHSRFGLPEILRGVMPLGGGMQYLPRFIPRAKAAEILLMGQQMDAQEAHRIGLVNRVVLPEQLMPTALEWAETICQASPLAVRASKEAMLRGYDLTLAEGFQVDSEVSRAVDSSEDSREGVRAFIEKRKPVWKGK
ncbi:MAG: enoyl-CoA hydratase/isomerase family protein [Chloroflexi bacterium]|nr:enoyl-CoA hydratase/isomerase family protein [Chloroflexota bacterium]